MTTVTLQPELVEQVNYVAEIMGIGTERLVSEAIQKHLRHIRREKLESEIASFESMYENLKEQYLGQFVAIHNGEVIDSDDDFESVFLRVQERVGHIPVLIRRVSDEPQMELHFRSPRIEWVG